MITDVLQEVLKGHHLSQSTAKDVMDFIMNGEATDAQIAGLLVAMKINGESIDEIAGFVLSMRQHAIKVNIHDKKAIDGCGTGGDGSDSFNVSTGAVIVAAGAGATVAKHGNRSVSSKCGSSDVLEKTGGNIDPGPISSEKLINEIGFGFLFAPKYHPAMKYAIGPRRELGVRTVFNILGPMTNPAGVKRQVIGVYNKSLLRLIVDVLHATGSEHVITAHSLDGMDEFSVSAPTEYVELKDGSISNKQISPEEVGLKAYPSNALLGGDATYNLSILRDVLDGIQSPYRDAVLFNAGALLYVADKAGSITEGVEIAGNAIDSGAGKEKLRQWIERSNQ